MDLYGRGTKRVNEKGPVLVYQDDPIFLYLERGENKGKREEVYSSYLAGFPPRIVYDVENLALRHASEEAGISKGMILIVKNLILPKGSRLWHTSFMSRQLFHFNQFMRTRDVFVLESSHPWSFGDER